MLHAIQSNLYEGERARLPPTAPGVATITLPPPPPICSCACTTGCRIRSKALRSLRAVLKADPDPMQLGAAYAAAAARPLRLMSLLSANVRLYAIFFACIGRDPGCIGGSRSSLLTVILGIGIWWHRAVETRLIHNAGRKVSTFARTPLALSKDDESMPSINIALVGVGNCASSLVQGLAHYRPRRERHDRADARRPRRLPPKRHPGRRRLGHRPAQGRQGRGRGDLRQAQLHRRSSATRSPPSGATCDMGRMLDGVAEHMADYPDDRTFLLADAPQPDQDDVVRRLQGDRDRRADELSARRQPGGDRILRRMRARGRRRLRQLHPGVHRQRPGMGASASARRGVPIIGDDIKAQLGATIVHRVLTDLFAKRGVKLERTYQLNTGGNTDFLNMLEPLAPRRRRRSRKTEAVQSVAERRLDDDNIHIGPSDYVAWQNDNKVCFLRMEGTMFGGVPMNLELRLSVEDSPNSAGVAIDMIRCAKLAQRPRPGRPGRRRRRPISASTRREQMTDDLAARAVEELHPRREMIETAILLAAGEGSRLRSAAQLKPLCSVAGRSLLEHAVSGLADAGLQRGRRRDRLWRRSDRRASSTRIPGRSPSKPSEPTTTASRTAHPCSPPSPWLATTKRCSRCATIWSSRISTGASRLAGASGGARLGVDRRIDSGWVDLEDVTRVRTEDERIVDIGKGIATLRLFRHRRIRHRPRPSSRRCAAWSSRPSQTACAPSPPKEQR